MNKEEVEKWCEENNYLLVDLSKKKIPAETIIKIAEASVDIDNIKLDTRRPQYPFARSLAASYLYKKMPNNKMAVLLGVKHDMVNYYMNQNVLGTELKYFKEWQRESLVFFKDKIKEIESSF